MQETSRSQPAVTSAEGDHIPWGWVVGLAHLVHHRCAADLVGGATAYIGAMAALSHVTKMLAAYFGGKAALRDAIRLRRAVVT
jgi:hypothetical protein